MDIFERASRAQLRFNTTVGMITTEDLWDLPLTARNGKGLSLDALAQGVYAQLKARGEAPSFVEPAKPDQVKTELELKLDIIKYVIKSKQDEAAAAEKRAATIERKQKLLEILDAKDDEKLKSMSREEIEKELNELAA